MRVSKEDYANCRVSKEGYANCRVSKEGYAIESQFQLQA